MSWSPWPATGISQPGIVQAPLINPAPNVVNPAAGQYTQEQWAQLQQQNWQQWAQWQQQYQQWQQQYGAEYQKSLSALQIGTTAIQPSMPFTNVGITAVPPPLPLETKPPPPPDDTQSRPNVTCPPPSYMNTPPPPISQPNFNTAPPPIPANKAPDNSVQNNPSTSQAGGYINRNKNESYSAANQQHFSNNQNFPNNTNNSNNNNNRRNQNWQNQSNFNENRFNKPPPQLNQTEYKKELGNKRPYNQPSNEMEAKRNKIDNNDNKWKGIPNKRDEVLPLQANSQQGNVKSTEPVSALKPNPEELTEAEKKFDKQFAIWELQFEKWKSQNANHPDKEQYREYEKKWDAWRSQLLDRREQMRRKRLGITDASPLVVEKPLSKSEEVNKSEITTAKNDKLTKESSIPFNSSSQIDPENCDSSEKCDSSEITQNQTNVGKQTDISASNTEVKQLDTENDKKLEKEQNNVLQGDLKQSGSGFLKTTSPEGIPGLDLVKDGKEDEMEDSIQEKEPESSKPDLEAISRGINSILGDKKIMNMLTLVSQNQNCSNTSDAVKTSSPVKVDSPKFSPDEYNKEDSNQDDEFYESNNQEEFLHTDDQTRSTSNEVDDAKKFDNSGNANKNVGGNQGTDNWTRTPEDFNEGFNSSNNRFDSGDFRRDFGRDSKMNRNNFNLDSENFNTSTDGFGRTSNSFDRGPDNFSRGSDNFSGQAIDFKKGPFNAGNDGFKCDNYNKGTENRGFNNYNRGPTNIRGSDNFYRGSDDISGTDNFNKGPDNIRGSDNFNRGSDHFNRGPDNFNRGPDNFNRGPDNFNRGPDNFNRGPDNFNRGPDNFNRGPDNFNRGPDNFNRGPDNVRGIDNFSRGSDNTRGFDNFNRGPNNKGFDNFNKGVDNIRGPDNFNRGPDSIRGSDNFNRGPVNRRFDNFNRGPDNIRGSDSFNRGPDNRGLDNFKRGFDNIRGSDNFNRGRDNIKGSDHFNRGSDNIRGFDNFKRGPDNIRGTDTFNKGPDNRVSNNFNRFDNFNRGQDNFNTNVDNFTRNDGYNKVTDTSSRMSENLNRGSNNLNRGTHNVDTNVSLKETSNVNNQDSFNFNKDSGTLNRNIVTDMNNATDNFNRNFSNLNREVTDFNKDIRSLDNSTMFNKGSEDFSREHDRFNNKEQYSGGSWRPSNDNLNNRTFNNSKEITIPTDFNSNCEDATDGFQDNQSFSNEAVLSCSMDNPEIDTTQEEGIWKPKNVIDYEHKSTKKEPDEILEVVRSFDYRHKLLSRIPYPERPKWLSDAIRNYPEFNLMISTSTRLYEHMRRYSGNQRFDDFVKYEDRDRFDERDRDRFDERDRDRFDERDRDRFDERDRNRFDERDRDRFDERDRDRFDERDRNRFDERDRNRFDERDRKDERDHRSFNEGDRKLYERDRKAYERDRKPHDYDKKPYGRDKRSYDRDRRYGEKDDKKPYNDQDIDIGKEKKFRDDWDERDRNINLDYDERDRSYENMDKKMCDERDKKSGNQDDKNASQCLDEKKSGPIKKAYGRDDSEFKNLDGDTKIIYEKKQNREHSKNDEDQFENKSFNSKMLPIKSNITLIEDLLNAPGRYNRPSRLVIILRGPPGSGKSYLAKLIKDTEVENGGSAPRILCLDDYFMVEQDKDIEEDGKKIKAKHMVYEYEENMEESYRQSLMKSFRKTITDGYFNFIIVDNINDKVKHFGEMWSFAKQNGFQVYICQMELDVQTCKKRNIHDRTEAEIEKCVAGWEETPLHHPILDATSLIQCDSIPDVEMEEINSPPSVQMNEEELIRSKWDNFEYSVDNLAKLDGINKPLRTSRTMEDYLQLEDQWVQPVSTKPGQKRVRWADLEERKQQEKMRAIGFVVGHTNWERMMDPTMGSGALTQTKYIERYS